MKISIITVCYNNLEGLRLTHQSIKNQTSQDYEWIVIDGKSSDGTVEYLKNIAQPDFYLSESDHGIYDAMNKGFQFVSGSYIIYLNSGDVFLDENTLQLSLNRISEISISADVILFDFNLKLPNGLILKKYAREMAKYIWHGMPTCHQSIFFSRDVIKNNPYDLNYKICGDYYLLANIYKKGYLSVNAGMTMAIFEVGGTSFKNPWTLMFESYKIKRDVLKLNYFLRFFSFIKSLISIYGLQVLSLKIYTG